MARKPKAEEGVDELGDLPPPVDPPKGPNYTPCGDAAGGNGPCLLPKGHDGHHNPAKM